jgi:hypothetical protein
LSSSISKNVVNASVSTHIITVEYVSATQVRDVAHARLLQTLASARNAATFLLGIGPWSNLTSSYCGRPPGPHLIGQGLGRPVRLDWFSAKSERWTRQEATMEIKTRLNVLATMMSFVFLAAIVFGMI